MVANVNTIYVSTQVKLIIFKYPLKKHDMDMNWNDSRVSFPFSFTYPNRKRPVPPMYVTCIPGTIDLLTYFEDFRFLVSDSTILTSWKFNDNSLKHVYNSTYNKPQFFFGIFSLL